MLSRITIIELCLGLGHAHGETRGLIHYLWAYVLVHLDAAAANQVFIFEAGLLFELDSVFPHGTTHFSVFCGPNDLRLAKKPKRYKLVPIYIVYR